MNFTNDLSENKTTLHGVFMVIFNYGVLLTGKSGVGKSECALALIDRNHQLICDDAPLFIRQEDRLMGYAASMLRHHLEVRGLGVIAVNELFGNQAVREQAPLSLVIELISPTPEDERSIETKLTNKYIMGIPIPHLTVSVMLKHHLAILIETAVKSVFTKL